MLRQIRPALVTVLFFTLILGLAYPLTITGLAQIAYSSGANGSLTREGDRIIGSALIGQFFAGDGYFHPRPSATATPYDAGASGGSNLGPLSAALGQRIAADLAALGGADPVPADAVNTSASGLDPHISPDNARRQVERVAAARGLDRTSIDALVEGMTEHPTLGFIGEPRVNVLMLNLALDKLVKH